MAKMNLHLEIYTQRSIYLTMAATPTIPVEEDLDSVLRFRKEHPKNYKTAREITSRLDILAKIYKNVALFEHVETVYSPLYANVDRALEMISDSNEVTAIYLADIDLYAMFHDTEYDPFLEHMQEFVAETSIKVECYEVTLAKNERDLVFTCIDKKHFRQLQDYAEEYFGEGLTTISGDQITVHLELENETEIINAHHKLYGWIFRNGNATCANSMKQIPVIFNKEYGSYKYVNRNNLLHSTKENDLIDCSKTTSTIPIINGPIIHEKANDKIISSNLQEITKDIKQIAVEWVQNNPPNYKEKCGNYYNRYYENHDNVICKNRFKIIMHNNGFSSYQGTDKKRFWCKTSSGKK